MPVVPFMIIFVLVIVVVVVVKFLRRWSLSSAAEGQTGEDREEEDRAVSAFVHLSNLVTHFFSLI